MISQQVIAQVSSGEVLQIERVIEAVGNLVVDEERLDRVLLMSHLCAYRKAGELARGKRLLEIGSGGGYGAYYLSHLAREVMAIDMEVNAIRRSQKLFQRPNLTYLQGYGVPLAFPTASFECVGTFQVIEHIPEPQLPTFVSEIARVLTADGVAIISTMNLDHNRKNADYQKFYQHEKEFTAPELEALLCAVFPRVELLGLHPRARYRVMKRLKRWGALKWAGGHNPVARFFTEELSTEDHVLRKRCDRCAIDLIAICRK